MTSHISHEQVKHVAELANIPVSEKEVESFTTAFTETLGVVDNLQKLDTSTTEPTHQVTGLENTWREDEVDEEQTLSQAEALYNAPATHNGYFLVDRIVHNE